MRRTKEEIDRLKKVTDYRDILALTTSMKLYPSSMASWEKDLLIQRAKELNIKGMNEFLEFGDYSWIRRVDFPKHEKRGASIGKGVTFGRLALPATKGYSYVGGFNYRENKKSKRNNSSKINSDREG